MHKILILSLALSSCSSATERNLADQSLGSVRGEWTFVDPQAIFYRKLTFADSLAEFTSLGDTIYRFKYRIDNQASKLILTDMLGKKDSSRIVKLDDDSLVVDRLWEKRAVQRFYKKNKSINAK